LKKIRIIFYLFVVLGNAVGLADVDSQLSGEWSPGCVMAEDATFGLTESLTLNATDYKMVSIIAAGAGCSQPLYRMEEFGKYGVGPAVSSISGAHEFNQTIEKILFTLFDAGYAQSYNDDNWCGFSDWAVGIPKDISGRTCRQSVHPAHGATRFGIYRVDTVGGRLALSLGRGDSTHDGQSPTRRPVELDDSILPKK